MFHQRDIAAVAVMIAPICAAQTFEMTSHSIGSGGGRLASSSLVTSPRTSILWVAIAGFLSATFSRCSDCLDRASDCKLLKHPVAVPFADAVAAAGARC